MRLRSKIIFGGDLDGTELIYDLEWTQIFHQAAISVSSFLIKLNTLNIQVVEVAIYVPTSDQPILDFIDQVKKIPKLVFLARS